jgi:glycosyltransferase involved in cell wall biosynthesis
VIALYRLFQRVQPRIVHTHMAKAGLLGRLAATAFNWTRRSGPRARIVHTYHGHVLEGYFSPVMTRVFVWLERAAARLSDRLIAISPSIRRELIEVYGIGAAEQYRTVPLGFDLAALAALDDRQRVDARVALGITSDVPVVTTVGRVTAIKQPHLFLDTVARLTRTRPNLIALIAGGGELQEEAAAYARALGIEHHVRWLGWRQDLETVYGATDVFLLTSRNEGTPVALIEAMAAAVPGVSTDVGGVRDVIDSPRVGLLAPSGDAIALAAAVDRLLADPYLRRGMGTAARESVLGRFSKQRLVADIAALYQELLEAR